MPDQYLQKGRLLLALTALTAWFAVITQLVIYLDATTVSTAETFIRFFSFFTILSNILTAVCTTAALFKPGANFFTKQGMLAATAVYISIVGIVYNLVLRNIWNPVGMQKLVDELLHVAVPVLYVAWWIIFVPKEALKWKNAFTWLLYPLIYCIFILLRGIPSHYYPYPFMDVNAHGYPQVAVNCAFVCGAFLAVSFLFIAFGKIRSKKQHI